ncbi:SDR family NAD(P)-dependent oxidoreductase [Alteribacter aurantiacus]|uniref:SDR family NAD(P)-dependent oxidoreductase n=1 Tax=Alteribacter aurantiacus TaxID=254410 RepID=UPI0004210BD9|nr:SDR family NAD(P)-dependent oxidoreductase [Alteribacter aurantiacus]
MTHALIVGGTGMLKEVSLWLNDERFHVSVIGRRKERLLELENHLSFPTKYTPLPVDYIDEQNFRKALNEAQQQNGPVDMLVAWVHGKDPQAIQTLVEVIGRDRTDAWTFVHVLGSSSNLESLKEWVNVPSICMYRQVKLGFVIEGDTSRWLTHHEISRGVIEAIEGTEREYVIGYTDPWERRP